MKITTLKERIEKAEARIEKKKGTIEKKQKLAEKKMNTLESKYSVKYDEHKRLTTDELTKKGLSMDDAWTAYWLQCDIDSLFDDLERIPKEIAEIEKTLEKYRGQLAGEIAKEFLFLKEIPKAMKSLEQALIKEWDAWDIKRRETLRKIYDAVGYNAFFKGTEEKHYWDKHTYADYEHMSKSDEEIHESNCQFARQEIIDMYMRVKDVTGEVLDWSFVTLTQGNNFPVLNGKVIGKEGTAIVESIEAGGYNIQRLHIRTLVHSI